MKNYLPAILFIESAFPRYRRHQVRAAVIFFLILTVLAAGYFKFAGSGFLALSVGASLIFLGIILKLTLLDAFFYSVYVRSRILHEKTFPLLMLLNEGKGADPIAEFAASRFGFIFLMRLGVSGIDVPSCPITAPLQLEGVKTLGQYVALLAASSSDFDAFLRIHGVLPRHIEAVGEWIERSYDYIIERERWWSRENLARIPGIGKDWAYGQTYTLEKHGRFINSFGNDFELYKKEVETLESILVKTQSANAIVISDTDTVRMAIIENLSVLIANGTAHPSLEFKKVFMLDSLALAQAANTQALFESELTKLLYEAERVGNIIFVIDNLQALLQSAASMGVDVIAVLVPYFRSSSMQCVALAGIDDYYKNLQSKAEIREHFELVRIDIKDQNSIIRIAEDKALDMEYRHRVYFTYQAIEAVVDAARTYFQADTLATKAIDLVVEIAPRAVGEDKKLITKEDVMEFVGAKTGIPVGEVRGDEKGKLLNLEALLHERVIGQDEAVKAISQAVRRARSGVGKTDRPIGSFLFLGPTGVGKTETAKALGDIFFGDKVPMVRFDMSEYSGGDALARLIGDNASLVPGLLANAVREHQYGVLLLDEFEKASGEVHNLFLQILDEGYFSDVLGKRVNARNLIIIATSNAQNNFFRPELLNRFDGVISFQPLESSHLIEVTKLMLKGLATRLKEKGIDLEINDDLISVLMEKGFDQKFGARPMNRAIADLVEEKIAEGLISGTIKAGDKIRFIKNADGSLNILK